MAHKPEIGYCINCDNRHGCKSKIPPCIDEMTRNGVKGMSGKQYLTQRGRKSRCEGCPFFRSCWNEEEFRRA